MANHASFTRSAARATSSAYRRLPIRWRLAGGSAALTLVILCGFAAIVGPLSAMAQAMPDTTSTEATVLRAGMPTRRAASILEPTATTCRP